MTPDMSHLTPNMQHMTLNMLYVTPYMLHLIPPVSRASSVEYAMQLGEEREKAPLLPKSEKNEQAYV